MLLKGEEVQRARTVSDFWQRARWVEINKAPVMGRWVPPVLPERWAAELSWAAPIILLLLLHTFSSLPLSLCHYLPPCSLFAPPTAPPPFIPPFPPHTTPLVQMNPNKQRMDWQRFWHRPFISLTERCLEGERGGIRERETDVEVGGLFSPVGWLAEQCGVAGMTTLRCARCSAVTSLSIHQPGAAICQGHHQEN